MSTEAESGAARTSGSVLSRRDASAPVASSHLRHATPKSHVWGGAVEVDWVPMDPWTPEKVDAHDRTIGLAA